MLQTADIIIGRFYCHHGSNGGGSGNRDRLVHSRKNIRLSSGQTWSHSNNAFHILLVVHLPVNDPSRSTSIDSCSHLKAALFGEFTNCIFSNFVL